MSVLLGIPKCWQWVKLRDIADVVTGNTPPTSDKANYGGTTPFFKPPQLNDGFLNEAPEALTEKGLKTARLLPPKTVLVSCIGILGKTALTEMPSTTNQQINAVVFNSQIKPEYGFYYTQTLSSWLKENSSATTVPIVNKGKFELAPFPLAPKSEQTRIVAKLEELLSDLDVGVTELKAAQKKLTQYRQSLLKAAVDGSLTAEWRKNNPPTETGAQLLERMLKERRARWEAKQLAKLKEQGKTPPKDWQKKYPEPAKPNSCDLPDLPSDWAWAHFDQVFEPISDNGKKLAQTHYLKSGTYPVIDQGASSIGGYTEDGSLLFCDPLPIIIFGDHTRRFKLVTRPFVIGADGVKLIGLSKAWSPYFAFLACESLEFEDRGYSRHFQFVRGAVFPLPPIAEQSQIVSIFLGLDNSQQEFGTAIRDSLTYASAQRQNILRAAFAGKLVPQDPNDEPASVLLERIRAEREAQAKPKPRGRKKVAA